MKKKIVIYSNFNTPNYMNSPYLKESSKKILNEDWINSRMDIFYQFTLESLIGQTNQNFTAVYNYTDLSEELVLKSIKNHGALPDNILFVPRSKYAETIDKLTLGYDQLYLTKLDSDDMYINTFVDTLHNLEPKEDTEVLICNYGYMYNTITNEMAKIWHTSASFHSYIYKLNKEKIKYDSLDLTPLQLLDESHFSALKHKYEYLPGYNFIWIIHNNNSSTRFNIYNNNILKTISIIPEKYISEIFFDFL